MTLWMIWGNRTVARRVITVKSSRLPAAFSGYRIAVLSDLHNAEYGRENAPVLEILRDAQPDMIAVTGDLIHSSEDGMEHALHLMQEAVKIAPCCFVTGNHESYLTAKEYRYLEASLQEAGVQILRDSRILVEKDGETIAVAGIDDPSFAETFAPQGIGASMDLEKLRMAELKDGFTVLLSHRPEYFDTYRKAGIDLVLCGHAHGGQFRLPLIGGFVAPHQGLFPQYDSGLYTKGTTHMIVSRGIGNSLIPVRFNNRPEVVIAELERIQGEDIE